jgi:hypothetical protein
MRTIIPDVIQEIGDKLVLVFLSYHSRPQTLDAH